MMQTQIRAGGNHLIKERVKMSLSLLSILSNFYLGMPYLISLSNLNIKDNVWDIFIIFYSKNAKISLLKEYCMDDLFFFLTK